MRAPKIIVRDGRTLQQPVQRDLGHTLFGFFGYLLQRVDHFVQIFVGYRWSVFGGLVKAAAGGQGLAAANLSRQAAPSQRAPDQGANPLIEPERHQFPFVFSADERIVDLVANVAGPAVAIGDGERFHQVPAGKIGAGDVANFSALDQLIEAAESLFDGRERVESVEMVDVDVVGAEAAQAGFAGLNQMMA